MIRSSGADSIWISVCQEVFALPLVLPQLPRALHRNGYKNGRPDVMIFRNWYNMPRSFSVLNISVGVVVINPRAEESILHLI